MMLERDIYEASQIVTKLGKLNAEACALELNVKSAGVRMDDSASTWIDVPASARSEVVRIAKRHNTLAQAALRRRAAQIGLVLTTQEELP